jgi:2-(1,2-epoxy-1,2-dihydrophenyl)acetyl-CoA isomerase
MGSEAGIAALVRALYDALERGDGEAIEGLLDPAFEGQLADGLPLGLGGKRVGPVAMREQGWWAIGRAFAVRAEPHEWIECADGRLLVLGRYAGHARSTGHPLDAAFAHVWSARDGRLTELMQLTDTALWARALDA